jgi:translation initiation factor IF-3
VGIEGEPLGIMSLTEAFAKAEEADIDLVEIAPNAEPPVCRLMDYGKFKYAESKKQHEVKLKQKQVSIKEVKFRQERMTAITPLKCATSFDLSKTAIKQKLHCVLEVVKLPIKSSVWLC